MPHSARRARALSPVMAILIVSLSTSLGAGPIAAATPLLGGGHLLTALPPTATFNTAYSTTLQAAGGSGTRTWSVTGGSPPIGQYTVTVTMNQDITASAIFKRIRYC